jgi:ribosomal protein S18 acetylase RimI-like enzyme
MNDAGFQVRAYQHVDEHAVVRLWETVFPDDPAWNEPRAVIRRKLTVQPELFLIALRAGSVVGTTLAGFDGVRGWVHHVAVAPNLRRQGIGRLLMQEAADRLRDLGCPKLNLQVRASNPGAVSFYERLGFLREERISFGQLLEQEA